MRKEQENELSELMKRLEQLSLELNLVQEQIKRVLLTDQVEKTPKVIEEPEVIVREEAVEADMPNEQIMSFLDISSLKEKAQFLRNLSVDSLTDRNIDLMAIAVNVTIEEGPLEQRFSELVHCINQLSKWEVERK